MTLLRGFADDLNLCDWLENRIWPAEAEFCSPEFVEDSCELGIAESIMCGTTAINDMYWYPATSAKVFEEAGIRAMVGISIIEFPTNQAKDADSYIEQGLKAMDEYKKNPKSSGRIEFALGPHAPYTVTDETFLKVKKISEERNMLIHTHLHETAGEVKASISGDKQDGPVHLSKNRCSPIHNFEKLGLLNNKLIAVHMTCLSEEEIALVAEKQVNLVHCPQSNMKLSSGVSPVKDLLEQKVNTCLGTDSTGSNNSLNMLQEIKAAALLSKVSTLDPTALPAQDVLKMACINGAKALRWERMCGALEIGKPADFITIQVKGSLELEPMYDPLSHLVYVCTSEHVRDVWVDGKCLMKQRKLLTIDTEKLLKKVQTWNKKLSEFRTTQLEKKIPV